MSKFIDKIKYDIKTTNDEIGKWNSYLESIVKEDKIDVLNFLLSKTEFSKTIIYKLYYLIEEHDKPHLFKSIYKHANGYKSVIIKYAIRDKLITQDNCNYFVLDLIEDLEPSSAITLIGTFNLNKQMLRKIINSITSVYFYNFIKASKDRKVILLTPNENFSKEWASSIIQVFDPEELIKFYLNLEDIEKSKMYMKELYISAHEYKYFNKVHESFISAIIKFDTEDRFTNILSKKDRRYVKIKRIINSIFYN